MAGVLTHLTISLIGFLIGTYIFKNWKYGIGFAIGHVIPDVIDFGILGLFTGSLNPAEIMTHPWFRPLAVLGHTWWHWAIFGVVCFVIFLVLYKFKKISKKNFYIFSIILIFFLVGVGVHLIVDRLIIETSYWI